MVFCSLLYTPTTVRGLMYTHRHTYTYTHRHSDTETHRYTDTQRDTHRHTDAQHVEYTTQHLLTAGPHWKGAGILFFVFSFLHPWGPALRSPNNTCERTVPYGNELTRAVNQAEWLRSRAVVKLELLVERFAGEGVPGCTYTALVYRDPEDPTLRWAGLLGAIFPRGQA